MRKADIRRMEAGNLIFGHSRGRYAVPRGEYQEAFLGFLEASGFDGYGYCKRSHSGTFENDVFLIRPYCWGTDGNAAKLPNFVYKPEGVEISWYKYPLRDAYCNKDIPLPAFRKMLYICAESIR